MLRATACALVLALLLVPVTFAEDAKKAPTKLTLATDEQAEAILAIFKEDWKAKGLKGDDRVSQRDYAMRKISKVHHPKIVDALGKASRDRHPDVRMIALIYLGDQKALPHLASQHVLKAMRKSQKDIPLLMTGLQTLGELKYLGARKEVAKLIKHRHFVVKKAAIQAVGRIGDKRMLREVLSALGMKYGDDGNLKEPEKSGGKEVVEEGYSWEGAEAKVDYGDSDNTKREIPEAKKKAEAQIAKNKAAAMAGRGGGGGGSGGMGGLKSGGSGASSRSTEELIPTILKTLKALTGEEFDKPSSIRKWVKDNKKQLARDLKGLDEKEKAQKAAK
ncbi:MAG: HEAT repeat domain-containing protein [Planctomycetota bacterium]|nr:HEAT repeat domain-containing protein [Planctomycetota bacterium]